MAIQEGISSKRTATGPASTRGFGLMDVLDFIGNLKSEDALSQIVMISGRSKIIIDYDYPIVINKVGARKEGRRQLIFNKNKNLHEPQDNKKVILMPYFYKGTIITGRFKISDKFLEKEIDNGRENNNRP